MLGPIQMRRTYWTSARGAIRSHRFGGYAKYTSALVAPAQATVLGGVATAYDSNMASFSSDLVDLVPVPPPQLPSLQGVLEEMTASVNDYHIISRKLQDSDWRPVFSSLTRGIARTVPEVYVCLLRECRPKHGPMESHGHGSEVTASLCEYHEWR
jgi:hypothetical protein